MNSFFSKFVGDRKFYAAVLTVAIPLMIQQLISSSVNLVDNMMVGQLGDAALGGVAAVNRFYMIANFGTLGVMNAAAIFIAQFFGARKEEEMKQSFRFSLISGLCIVIPFCVLMLCAPNWILRFFTDDAAIIAQGEAYIVIAALTFLPLAVSYAIDGAMRAIGETKIPLFAGTTAVLVNCIGNYCLIFGKFGCPQLGVQGAAYATLLARITEVVILLVVLKVKSFPFKTRILDMFKVPASLAKNILVKAAPLTLNELLWSFGMAMLFKFYGTRGAEVMSGYSVATTVSDLFFVLFGGMAAATNVMVSQPLGADRLEEGRKNGYRMIGFSIMLSLIFAVLMFVSSYVIVSFYEISERSMSVAETFLRVQSVMFWIYMANTECYFVLRAGGDTKSTLFMDSVFMWCINLPLVGLFAYLTRIDIIALYIIGQCTDLIKLGVAYWLVSKEKWVKNITISEN